MVITRFAPSPTGNLHIGSARTALFNYLFARHNNGKFILRIENTDFQRSSKIFEDNILFSLCELGIDYDELQYQSDNVKRHIEVAYKLVELGYAYYCYSPQTEIEEQRRFYNSNEGEKMFIFRSPWRDKQEIHQKDFVIRFKTSRFGSTTIQDNVQGEITVQNRYIEDFIILRSDFTSTYMLAAAVDDHDSSVTHVIRGDDHINNTFKQELIYRALGWNIPQWVHISLLHDSEGKKLSKRSGLDSYSVHNLLAQGYLSESIRNYILKLGWSHGDDEIISKEQSIKWFNLNSLGKSAARIDFNKLNYLNNFYLNNIDNVEIMKRVEELYLKDHLKLSKDSHDIISRFIPHIKKNANNILQIYDLSKIFILENQLEAESSEVEFFKQYMHKDLLEYLLNIFKEQNTTPDESEIKYLIKDISLHFNLQKNIIFKIFRIFLTANKSSISVYSLIYIFGPKNLILRLKNFYAKYF